LIVEGQQPHQVIELENNNAGQDLGDINNLRNLEVSSNLVPNNNHVEIKKVLPQKAQKTVTLVRPQHPGMSSIILPDDRLIVQAASAKRYSLSPPKFDDDDDEN